VNCSASPCPSCSDGLTPLKAFLFLIKKKLLGVPYYLWDKPQNWYPDTEDPLQSCLTLSDPLSVMAKATIHLPIPMNLVMFHLLLCLDSVQSHHTPWPKMLFLVSEDTDNSLRVSASHLAIYSSLLCHVLPPLASTSTSGCSLKDRHHPCLNLCMCVVA
jgi:hypothetical protein